MKMKTITLGRFLPAPANSDTPVLVTARSTATQKPDLILSTTLFGNAGRSLCQWQYQQQMPVDTRNDLIEEVIASLCEQTVDTLIEVTGPAHNSRIPRLDPAKIDIRVEWKADATLLRRTHPLILLPPYDEASISDLGVRMLRAFNRELAQLRQSPLLV